MINGIKNSILAYKINYQRFLMVLFFVALVFHAAYVIIVDRNLGTTIWVDDWYYYLTGMSITVDSWPYLTESMISLRVAPGLPFIVAFLTVYFGEPIVPFYIMNILLSSTMVVVVCHLAKVLYNVKVAYIVGIWSLINIEFYRYTPHILKEPLLYFLLPLILYLISKWVIRSHKLLLIGIIAIFFAFLIHIDERYIVYYGLIAAIILLNQRITFKRRIVSLLVFSSLVLTLMVPWIYRNYIVYDQLVILSTRTTVFTSRITGKDLSNINLLLTDDIMENDTSKNCFTTIEVKKNNFEPSRLFIESLVNIWQPVFFKEKEVKYSWWPEPRHQRWSLKHNLVSLFLYGLFIPFYIVGIALLMYKRMLYHLILALIPIFNSVLHAYLVMPEERYRYPVVFVVVIIGTWACLEISYEIKRRLIHHNS